MNAHLALCGDALCSDPGSEHPLQRVAAGDRSLFDRMYGLYFPRVYGYALQQLGDAHEAEAVTREVLLRAFGTRECLPASSTLPAWFLELTRTELRSTRV